MSEAINTRTVTLAEAESRIVRAFKNKRPVFLWGLPGVGKSELMQGVANKQTLGKTHLIDVRVALMEPTDLRGMPYLDKESNLMKWAPPVDLPSQELASQYDTVILFLDEMNSAAPAVQAAGYQLTLNRRIGQYVLPDNVVIVAAGNRESDKGVTYRMPTPLANRFVHLEVRVDFDSWLNWAVENKQHEDVVGYISFAKQDLCDFDPRTSGRSFATPRSWSYVSDFLNDETASNAELTDLISGCVGEGVAIKFMAHRKIAKDMPKPAEILAGKVKELKIKEISAQYALTIGMCYELKDAYNDFGKKDSEKWHKMADNFFRFMMDHFPTEMTVMGARTAITNYNLPFQPNKLAHFKEFFDRFGKYVVKAMES
tara:strand:- start:1226 stop:2338 length:1113 start_codon:yes stop_codon:yes gene_type:complete